MNLMNRYFNGFELIYDQMKCVCNMLKNYHPASEASRELANLFRPDLDSVFMLKSSFYTKIATQTCTICKGHEVCRTNFTPT